MRTLNDFFHFCSGIHSSILKRTPTDSNKYAGIGATVFFTGIFAAIASAFAIYTVFKSYTIALIFGLLWGLMIFNLDRYIVMSMKKKSNRFSEFIAATPRLVLALLISFVIAKPLELKLFQSEIASELVMMEQEVFKKQEDKVKERFDSDIDLVRQEIASLENQIQSKRDQRDALSLAAMQEADGTGGSQKRNMGPIYRAKKLEADKAESELNKTESEIAPLIIEKREQLATMEEDRSGVVTELERSSLDGFAAQLDALGRLTKKSDVIWYASLFITLLFIAIETAPIFTKLISDRSPYDYRLDEHEFVFQGRHLTNTSRLKNAIEYDMIFDREVGRFKNQLAMNAEKELLKDLVSQEVEQIKKGGLSWQTYIKNRNVFGSL